MRTTKQRQQQLATVAAVIRKSQQPLAAHSPGPWTFDEVKTSCGRAFRIGTGEMLVAGKGCCCIYDDYPANPENERKANARLIAAAPDLLAALQKALQCVSVGYGSREVELQMRAAIDKATK